jgi:uncharacterized membrane protein
MSVTTQRTTERGREPTVAPRTCPACGGTNSVDAVFCANSACGKALGELRYVVEEFAARQSWLERLAERTSTWVGHPHFVSLHLLWFALWAAWNSGWWPALRVFDAYPYGLLGIILAVEAALITSLLLIAGNQRSHFESHQAEVQYVASVTSYRLLRDIARDVAALSARVQALESGARE